MHILRVANFVSPTSGGITTALDMYWYPEVATEGADQSDPNMLNDQNRMLADEESRSGSWPRLALAVDTTRMAAETGRAFWSHVFYPQEGANGSFVRDFSPTVMSADTHRGYAVQWFGLAVVLVILTLLANSNLAVVIRERFRKSP